MNPATKAIKACSLLEGRFGRPKGWNAGTPIDALVNVILSQNTSDKNSWPAFQKLKKKYSSWEKVLAAPMRSIASAIRSGGLANIKANRIKRALREIKEKRGKLTLGFLSKLSTGEAKEFLLSLHGVGPKSAAIVLNFSFGRPEFPVDTHIYRVSKRLGLVPLKVSREKAQEIMNSLVPNPEKTPCHLNLIQLGRTICVPHAPWCSKCPLNSICPRAGVEAFR